MERKHMIYVSGAFTSYEERDADRRQEEQHRKDVARTVTELLFKAGWMVYNPFSGPLPLMSEAYSTDEDWMQQDRYILTRACHAILMLPMWERSKGATEEHDLMESLGRKIFYDIDEAIRWLYEAKRVWKVRAQQMPAWHYTTHITVCPNRDQHEDQPHNLFVQAYAAGPGEPHLRGYPVPASVWMKAVEDNYTEVTWIQLTCRECDELAKRQKKKGGK